MYIIAVLIQHKVFQLDQTYDYLSDQEIKPFCRVVISFNKSEIVGFVTSCQKTTKTKRELNEHYGYDLKEIVNVIDQTPMLNQELIDLGYWMGEKYIAPLIACFSIMLPSALKPTKNSRASDLIVSYVKINPDSTYHLSKSQQEIKDYLNDQIRLKKELVSKFSQARIKTLITNNYLIEIDQKEYRPHFKEGSNHDLNNLNADQLNAFNQIINQDKPTLLHGITGSGKTEVYIHLANYYLKQNKTVIMLVPEIALTPQIINRFKSHFNDAIAILHSKLSNNEKYDEYTKIKNGEVSIVVGARSAIFAPLDNIGIIILDEEHETTYQQDSHPQYDTIEVALKRMQHHNCKLLLASATPSLESYAKAVKGVYNLVQLNKRHRDALFPEYEIVDMQQELNQGNLDILSLSLKQAINEALDNNHQVILLLNRRGYANFASCRDCGYTFKCPHCDVSLTYHKTNDNLRCHYCNYAIPLPKTCPQCFSNQIKTVGIGIQQVEQELNKQFLNARVLRIDQDTTQKKNMLETMLEAFKNEEYNILLGTQMIAKGLDFKKVSLVGVINGDTSLNISHYSSHEKTFQLINQVAGRAGRHDIKGHVIIQTYNIDHYAITCALNNDYLSFFKQEMKYRLKNDYPPYYWMGIITLISSDINVVFKHSDVVYKYLNQQNLNNVIILKPTTHPLFKLKNEYRMQIIIKYKYYDDIAPTLIQINNKYNRQNTSKIRCNITLKG